MCRNSVTAQAIQLRYLPRIKIVHTAADSRGQVFAPAVNAIICVTVLGLILTFRSSNALAAAFGFAVTSTMVLTTLMMGFVMFRIWRVRLIWGVPVYAVLLTFDLALFAASSTKIPDGAWLPLAARYLTAPIAEGGLGFTGTQMGTILGLAGSIGAICSARSRRWCWA